MTFESFKPGLFSPPPPANQIHSLPCRMATVAPLFPIHCSTTSVRYIKKWGRFWLHVLLAWPPLSTIPKKNRISSADKELSVMSKQNFPRRPTPHECVCFSAYGGMEQTGSGGYIITIFMSGLSLKKKVVADQKN
jgi:hypothetical protein